MHELKEPGEDPCLIWTERIFQGFLWISRFLIREYSKIQPIGFPCPIIKEYIWEPIYFLLSLLQQHILFLFPPL